MLRGRKQQDTISTLKIKYGYELIVFMVVIWIVAAVMQYAFVNILLGETSTSYMYVCPIIILLN